MGSKTMRVATVVALALVLAIGASFTQAQEKPFVVCSDIPWDPFEMVTGAGEYFGFDLDVMRSIAIVEGYEIKIENLAFDSIIPAVQAGKCDIGASGFTITSEREEVVDFSMPYWVSNQAVIVRQDSGWSTLDDVFCCGHKLGAQRGTTGAAWVEDNLIAEGVDVELVLYETYPLAVLDLVNQRIAAVIQDEPASKSSVEAYPDLLTIVGVIQTNEYFGFNVAEGDPDGLLWRINRGMYKLGLRSMVNIHPGSPWDNLVRAYFGQSADAIEAAWLACKDLLLKEKDVEGFASCMAAEVSE
jgi:polar amino acid transport system substrate-binding protein